MKEKRPGSTLALLITTSPAALFHSIWLIFSRVFCTVKMAGLSRCGGSEKRKKGQRSGFIQTQLLTLALPILMIDCQSWPFPATKSDFTFIILIFICPDFRFAALFVKPDSSHLWIAISAIMRSRTHQSYSRIF